jgi:hypothetical protein
MSEIAEKLLESGGDDWHLKEEAADEITRLKEEVERLRAALGEAVMLLDNNQNNNPPHMQKYLAKWEAALTPSQEPRT